MPAPPPTLSRCSSGWKASSSNIPGQLTRAAVELAKDWRTDRYLRRLEAMMIVADKDVSLVLTGTGDVLEPEAGIVGIGSGGNYALAAARALADGPLDAEAIVRKSLDIAADICVYTNRNVTIETLKDVTDFSPREIVSELDRFIVGQADAKRAVAIALRNRWRRLQLDDRLREEVLPKNILMIGPTGVGKTEISRRLAKLAGAPFLKVEATKFTEVGYVGRDVEQIVRDLVEIAITLDARAKAQGRRGARPEGRRRSRARCAGRRQCQRVDQGGVPQKAARRRTQRQGDRDRGAGCAAAACRCSIFPACPARRWARSRSATFSASSAAAAPRRAASPCTNPTTS